MKPILIAQMAQKRTETRKDIVLTANEYAGLTQYDIVAPARLSVCFTIPYRLIPVASLREHWTKKHKRRKTQHDLMTLYFNQLDLKPSLPCLIKLIRIAPRPFDEDNLLLAFKFFRDMLANLLIPGLPMGKADGDPRITWSYSQEKGLPKTYAVRIEIYT
jgi:hypothetical protein